MTRQTTNSHPMHQALWVMLIMLAMALISAKPLAPFFGDNFGNLLTVRSLAEDGDLDIRNQLVTAQVDGSGYVALGKSGELFSVHEVLLAAVGAPFYLACGEQGLILLMALMTSLALWAVFSINQQIAPSTGLFVASTIFGVSSLPLLAFQNDLFAGCLFVLALCAGVHKRSYLSGLVAGFIPAARLPFAPLLLPLLLFPLLQKSLPGAAKYLVALLPGLLTLLALNQHMFDSPLIVSYFRQAYEGAEGMRVIDMRQTHFVGDIPEALGYILLSWP